MTMVYYTMNKPYTNFERAKLDACTNDIEEFACTTSWTVQVALWSWTGSYWKREDLT